MLRHLLVVKRLRCHHYRSIPTIKPEEGMKKLLLLTVAAVFALQMNFASAADDAETTQTNGGEECVIMEDEA